VQEQRGLRLVQVRNVLGRGRLQGTPWDPVAGEAWKAYADVYEELGVAGLPSHVFWVEYDTLTTLFDTFYVAWSVGREWFRGSGG
jgi:hypothetical protein